MMAKFCADRERGAVITPAIASSSPWRLATPPRFWLLTGLAFVLALLFSAALIALVERTRAQDERQMAAEIANLNAREIGDRLERALSASFALAAVVRQGEGHIDHFEPLAAEMIRTYGAIGTLQYAPNGVIRKVVPLAGNEAVIGFNPLRDPQQGFEAQKAVESHRLVLTGPLILIQGGYGVVGRYPVFLDEGTARERFWGLIQVVIRISDLLAVTSLGALETAGYRYELSRLDPQNGQKVIFARTGAEPLLDPVQAVIPVPGGQWALSVKSRHQGAVSVFLVAEAIGALLFSLLVALAMAMLQREPLRLRHEIEERRVAEAELQRSSARLHEIINTMDAGLALWDAEQKLLAWNGALEQMYPEVAPALLPGLARAKLTPMVWLDGNFAPEDVESAQDWGCLGTWDRRLTDGRIIAMQRLATADGGRLALHFDVTEARRSAEALARNERLASLGKLVAGIAHEVNTPIGNALMVASTMQQRVKEMEAAVAQGQLRRSELENFIRLLRESHEISLRNLTRAAELIQHFKQVAVDQVSDQRRPFDLATALEEIVATLGVRLRRSSHQLELDLAPEIQMDSFPGALGQIVSNFVENSLLHAFPGREGGQLRLSTRLLPDGRIELLYSDNGAGIAASDLPRVCDPFFTTKLGHGGSGLGLSIVLNLVRDLLGGELEIDSEPGGGSRFRLRMPSTAPVRAAGADARTDLSGLAE